MAEDALIPELRFAGFSEFWDSKRIDELVKRRSEKFDPKQEDLLPIIELESLTSETGVLLKTFDSDELKSIKNRFYPGDILYGKLRPYLKKYYLPEFEGAASSEIWVLESLGVDPVFFYYLVQTPKFDFEVNLTIGSKMPRADWNSLSQSSFHIPSILEQQKIASFHTAVDKRIQLLQEKKEQLDRFKKGVMQKLFSQEIRFKDDDGNDFPEWGQKKLGKLTVKAGRKNKENLQLPVYSINNQVGFLPQGDQFDGMDSSARGFDTSMYRIVTRNTFAYNPARINVGSFGYSGELDNIIISSLYVCFQTLDSIDDQYLLQYMSTYNFNKSVLRNVEGGVRDYLFYENFSNIKIPVPSVTEQLKIASFLQAIDEGIETLKEEIEVSQKFKKGLLQKMFV